MNVLSCQHFYWQIGGFQVHGQVLITSWVIIAMLLGSASMDVWNPQTIQKDMLFYRKNILVLPHGAAPTNDINTTTALTLLTLVAYFYASLAKKKKNNEVISINTFNELQSFFTKPLSFSFRLIENILADELVVVFIVSLVHLVAPIPVMFLGVFARGIGALIFTTL
ncbi:hypothetical protein EUGRSUZ_G00227 [Eucalyptus grandis]|uniref:Uncharacterized protein n=2 Tax=Eucalyptus grandis TaxID=71139 RepID=A0ACC3K074_EUCGR|nr:hypothetical protein EUGRSUZ_G00227 [Eucalyptus grandis]